MQLLAFWIQQNLLFSDTTLMSIAGSHRNNPSSVSGEVDLVDHVLRSPVPVFIAVCDSHPLIIRRCEGTRHVPKSGSVLK